MQHHYEPKLMLLSENYFALNFTIFQGLDHSEVNTLI